VAASVQFSWPPAPAFVSACVQIPMAAVRPRRERRKWRNYLAIGALGPALFYLMSDFTKKGGNIRLRVISWVLNE
jgi:hypothetical protein